MHLQADIEGYERSVLPHWIEIGLLKNVQQIGFEFHGVHSNLKLFSEIVVKLHQQGFRVISYEPNFCQLPKENHLYNLFEIVFKKSDVVCWDWKW